MSGTRNIEVRETEKSVDDQRKKAGDTLFLEAKMLFFKVKDFHEKTTVDKKLDEYRRKHYITRPKLSSPINPKKLLNQALLYSKASADMGNEEAKDLFKEAKTFQNTHSALEDGYILVQPPSEIEEIDLTKKEAITIPCDRKRKKPEEESEMIATKLHVKINFINNWYPDPDLCIESLVSTNTPMIQII